MAILRPSPTDAYPAYRVSSTSNPPWPVARAASLPPTQRAKSAMSDFMFSFVMIWSPPASSHQCVQHSELVRAPAGTVRDRDGSTTSQLAAPTMHTPPATRKDVVQPKRNAIQGVSEAVRAAPI